MKNCNSCGKCCETAGDGGLSASATEIDWWETYRPDIARYVQGNKIWVMRMVGMSSFLMVKCIILKKYSLYLKIKDFLLAAAVILKLCWRLFLAGAKNA